MCGTPQCQTRGPLKPGSERSNSFLQGGRECILEGMEAFNDTARCAHIPAAILKSSTPCTPKLSHKVSHLDKSAGCQTDVFIAKLDQNGTVFWVQNIVTNHTYMRNTPLTHLYFQQTKSWADIASLAYRQVPEKLSSSRSPATTLRLLKDKHLHIAPLYENLADAYHIEIQLNRTRLSVQNLRDCVSSVNSAFALLRESAYAGNLDFFNAMSLRSTYVTKIYGEVATHEGIVPAGVIILPNAAAYRQAILQSATTDHEFSAFTRAVITQKLTALNSRINEIDNTIVSSNYNHRSIVDAVIVPGLFFSGIVTKLMYYYAERIEKMRKAWGSTLSHREIQAIFECKGTLIQDFPVRPTNYDLQAGGMTLVLTLSADKFLPLTDTRKETLLSNMVSKYLPSTGFEKKIRPQLNSTDRDKIRLSEDRSTLTLTLPRMGAAGYSITSPETVSVSVPQSLTETGSRYPFLAQFVVRPDPTGLLWNTGDQNGDMYSRPTENDMQTMSTLTAHMSIAGDSFKDLTDQARADIINGFVPSGHEPGHTSGYSWNIVAAPAMGNSSDQMWLDQDNARLNIQLPKMPGYSISVAETIAVTIPGSVTKRGFSHPLGSFIVRPQISGTLRLTLTGAAAASGSFTIGLRIAADRFLPKSYETVKALAQGV